MSWLELSEEVSLRYCDRSHIGPSVCSMSTISVAEPLSHDSRANGLKMLCYLVLAC